MAEPSLAQRDTELWATRAAALAALAAADAIAVVLPLPDDRHVVFATHNVGSDSGWLDGPVQYLIWSALTQQSVQRRSETPVRLDDGRTARSVIVAPIFWSDRVVGALVALRESPTYDTLVGASLAELAALVGIELTVSKSLHQAGGPAAAAADGAELRRARDDRRHALALYEITRLALGGGPARSAEVVADTLDYGLVGIWLEEDGWLVLEDGYGYEGDPGRVRVDADGTLLRVVRDGLTQRLQRDAERPAIWMGPAQEVLAAPLRQAGRRGLLILGDPARPFSPGDLAIVPTLAECVGLAQMRIALTAPPAAAALPEYAAVTAPVTPSSPPEPAAARSPTAAAAPAAPATPPAAPPAPASDRAAHDPPEAARPWIDAPAELPSDDEAPARARRPWVLPLAALAVMALLFGVIGGEPLALAVAAVLILAALWGWLG